MTDEEIKEKATELTIKNVTDGKNKYFSLGFYHAIRGMRNPLES